MIPAPRELRKPSAYLVGYGTTRESPISITLTNIPFWDISALLSAVRYQVRSLPVAGSKDLMPRSQYRYRIEGMTDAHFGDGEVSFSFVRSTRLADMFARVKDVYETALIETYAQRARSEARLRTSLPHVVQPAGELVVAQTVGVGMDIIEHTPLPDSPALPPDSPHTLV